jgi:hypothetical protein
MWFLYDGSRGMGKLVRGVGVEGWEGGGDERPQGI